MELDISNLKITNISILENFLVTTDMSGAKRRYDVSKIETLNCDKNQLVTLPELPEGLKVLWCDRNLLVTLPTLPEGLKVLCCRENLITFLPSFPEGLKYLACSRNLLTSLPVLPQSLETLVCYGNQLKSLPKIPENLEVLDCHGNPLVCVQYLKERPVYYIVPSHLEEKHSVETYQKNYDLQTRSRYLVYFFIQRSKYYNTFRIFATILSEFLL